MTTKKQMQATIDAQWEKISRLVRDAQNAMIEANREAAVLRGKLDARSAAYDRVVEDRDRYRDDARRAWRSLGDVSRKLGDAKEALGKEKEYRRRQTDPRPHDGKSGYEKGWAQKDANGPGTWAAHWYQKYLDATVRETAAFEREEQARREVERLENENRELIDAGLRTLTHSARPSNTVFTPGPNTVMKMLQPEVTAIWDAGYAVGYRHGSTP